MRTVVVTAIQMLLVVAIASAIAIGANAQRGKNSLHLSRDYLTVRPVDPPPSDDTPDANSTGVAPPAPRTDSEPAHPYTLVTLDEAKQMYSSEDYLMQRVVFVDARSDEPYQAGRIPGALQLDHYRLDYYIGAVLPRVQSADTAIVYCNGGDCDDSIRVCQELENFGVPRANLRLFKTGWESWMAAGLPVETGPQKE